MRLNQLKIGDVFIAEKANRGKQTRYIVVDKEGSGVVRCVNLKRSRIELKLSGMKVIYLDRQGIPQYSSIDGNGVKLPEYDCWRLMIKRCEKDPLYVRRGIIVCERWLSSFEYFLLDMGRRPSPLHSIDRINNDGHYVPENCRWATIDVQGNNRSINVPIEFNGRIQNVKQWADELGIENSTLWCRLFKFGWTVDKAFTTPTRKHKLYQQQKQ
jgi:hypothetical protein